MRNSKFTAFVLLFRLHLYFPNPQRDHLCVVMEYCGGGDLLSLIEATFSQPNLDEISCFFKQLVNGVAYIHSMGVAVCNLVALFTRFRIPVPRPKLINIIREFSTVTSSPRIFSSPLMAQFSRLLTLASLTCFYPGVRSNRSCLVGCLVVVSYKFYMTCLLLDSLFLAFIKL